MAPTEEQKEQFLEYVRDGDNRQQAAEKVGSTGTRFRFLCNRDPSFNRRFEEAKLEGRGALADRLQRCAVECALAGEWNALKFLLTTYDDDFAWARSSKVEVAGQVEVHAIANVLSKYLPPAEYDKIIDMVEQRMLDDHEPPKELAA